MIDPILVKEQAPDLLSLVEPLTTLRKVSSSGGGEWSGPCPFCGGIDRFSVQPHKDHGLWLCRHCTDGTWKDSIEFVRRRDNVGYVEACQTLFRGPVKIGVDPEEYERIQEKREATIQERLEQEKETQQQVRDRLHEERAWEPYHQILQSSDIARQLWNERGLTDEWIDYYKVGYCPAREFYSPTKFICPTLTIPTWYAEKCVGLSHRLLMEDPPGGKYRPHFAGAGKPLFMADVIKNGLGENVLLLEGEIKTMVTFANIWKDQPLMGHPLYQADVVGIAGKGFKFEWVPAFDEAKNIWIVLDPDADEAAEKIAERLGKERCKVVQLPEKIDDLFLIDAIDIDLLWLLIEQAGSVK